MIFGIYPLEYIPLEVSCSFIRLCQGTLPVELSDFNVANWMFQMVQIHYFRSILLNSPNLTSYFQNLSRATSI